MSLLKGLVGHWTMDSIDVDNGMIRDRSGYDNHGTINGATPGYSGKVGRAFDFDGTDDYITTISDFSQVDTSSFTLSCWFNADSLSGFRGILNATDFNNGTRIFADGDANDLRFQLEENDDKHDVFAPLPSTNSWNHVVGRYDGNSTIEIILNNSLEDTNTNANLGNHSNSLLVGASTTDTDHFDGIIDDVRIYNRALSEKEIKALYNIRSRRSYGSPYVPPAIPDSAVLGFEDMSGWQVVNGGQTSDRVFSGSFSYYSGANDTDEQAILEIDVPINPSEIVYYYQETGDSFGSGVRFYNSNGNDELGTGTDNPAFTIDSSSGINTNISNSDDGQYDVWVKVIHTFDWSNNQVTVLFDRLDGSNSGQDTVTLKQGVDISRIELWNLHENWGEGNLDAWWDEFSITL